jgi:NADH-quinone oxidoreductase subunit M
MIDSYLVDLTLLPLVGALLVALMPAQQIGLIRRVALGVAVLTFLVSLPLAFNSGEPGYRHVVRHTWIPSLNISLHMGVDGISILMILLTTFITPLVLLSAVGPIKERVKEFAALMLAMETGMIGVFASLDLVLFYLFWEATLIPLYFIIGIWGGPRRLYAAVKFFIFTMAGSLPMLIAILYLVLRVGGGAGEPTANIEQIAFSRIPAETQKWLFLAFTLAFAVKVPLFPFHTWLPDAHVEAPTGGSVILAGVLLKMGTYGFVRFVLPCYPAAVEHYRSIMMVLAVIGIVYGALLAWAQSDLKKVIAYSSISHLGFVMLGLFAGTVQGIQGGVLQMVNHGLSTGALFLLVGMIYDRRHVRELDQFGGLASVMPKFAFFLVFMSLSSLGLPGLNGFVGEFLILTGTFVRSKWAAAIAVTGVILGAIYLLGMVKALLFGPVTRKENEGLRDLDRREILCLVPILVFVVWIGVRPNTFLDMCRASTQQLAKRMAATQVVPDRVAQAPEAQR